MVGHSIRFLLSPSLAPHLVEFTIITALKMASQAKNLAANQQASKNPTPASTAKPYGTSAKATPTKKAPSAESAAPESATATAQDDTVKAIEKLETRTKAVYVYRERHDVSLLTSRSVTPTTSPE